MGVGQSTAEVLLVDELDVLFDDGFLSETQVTTLNVRIENAEALRRDLGRLRRAPDEVEFEVKGDRLLVEVTYRAGTPEYLYRNCRVRLDILQRRHG